jgi:hypothetical protein
MKIAACVNQPRPFIRASAYFGPDRRRREEAPPQSERRTTPVAEAPIEPKAAVG